MLGRLRPYAVVLLVWAFVSSAPSGQTRAPQVQATGITIDGSVVDPSLGVLPGVTVTLERGGKVVATTTTGTDGKFTFRAVEPGTYQVRAVLTGFKTLTRAFTVKSEPSVLQLPLVLEVGSVSEEMTVQAATPVTDTKKTTTGGTARNIREAPPPPPPPASAQAGAGAGRGGSASGQQVGLSIYGTSSTAQWNLEGGSITDLASNSSPRYYNYDSFEQIPVTPPTSGESYAHVMSSPFRLVSEHPVSTFGADVDTASFSNVRRFLSSGQLPPRDAVRVEELVNYFHFNYAQPRGDRPIAITTEVGDCPWAPGHKLVLVGTRARASQDREPGQRNLVLLIDVSGSMQDNDKLPLVKTALGMFVDTLRPTDQIAIVTYAGTSGVALPPTPASDRQTIHRAIDGLYAGGSTNGGEGIITAYRIARQAFVPGGVNRVILATDGDFNVGITSQHDLFTLIDREKESGVFLSVLGVGTGNLKDSTMEMLADRGNGHYAYLDSLQEARRVLIRESDATLETVAKDVKFQVEFNPATVAAWKLIGYEDRVLAREDFNNDRKDAGDLGAGHTVTVLYEVVPPAALSALDKDAATRPVVEPLRYQTADPVIAPAPTSALAVRNTYPNELLNVKVRYKLPDADVSQLIEQPVRPGGAAPDLAFAAAAAEFGLLLRDGQSSLERWQGLTRRIQALPVSADNAADRRALADLVDLAAGLRKLSGSVR